MVIVKRLRSQLMVMKPKEIFKRNGIGQADKIRRTETIRAGLTQEGLQRRPVLSWTVGIESFFICIREQNKHI